MSTQRRENRSTPAAQVGRRGHGNRSTPATKARRRAPRNRWQQTNCAGPAGQRGRLCLAEAAPLPSAEANAVTAPPGNPAKWATDSLQMDYRAGQKVRLVSLAARRVLPSLRGVGGGAAYSATPTPRSSLVRIPTPSSFATFHPAWPQAPAGYRRRAERYDGKGNLHFFYAA